MSFNPVEAFKTVLKIQEKDATLSRRGEIADTAIRIAPSNYFRHFDTLEEIPITGNEFVLDKEQLTGTGFESTGPKRGDVLVSAIYGTLMLEEIKPLIIFGNLVGYRIRTNA